MNTKDDWKLHAGTLILSNWGPPLISGEPQAGWTQVSSPGRSIHHWLNRDARSEAQKMCRWGISGHGSAGMVVLGWQLDLMILEVFSNLWFYGSMDNPVTAASTHSHGKLSTLNVQQGLPAGVVPARVGSVVVGWWTCFRHGAPALRVMEQYFHQSSYVTAYGVRTQSGSSLTATPLGLWARRLWQKEKKNCRWLLA